MASNATGYIYNVDSNEILFVIEGADENIVEAKVEELGYMGVDEYGLAFRLYNELHIIKSTEYLTA